jgi:hypothetical protein
MAASTVFEGMASVKGVQTGWSPNVKLLLAFIIGFLVLLPATLGLYWEIILSRW